MKSILEELYFKLIENDDVLKGNKEYENQSEEYNKTYDLLEKGLTEEQKQILSLLWLAGAGRESMASCAYFKEGFKACMQIIGEVLKN